VTSRNWFVRKKIVVVGLLVVMASAIVVTAAVASFSGSKSEHWGVIPRNTIGSPVGDLRDGPYGSFGHTGPTSEPPFGKGSLGIEVADKATSQTAPQEKIAFGNEVDFFGDPFLDLTAVGFRVFQTGENVSYGGPGNLPNITFEIDPNLTGNVSNYTSVVWNPAPVTTVDEWSPYLDATTTGQWYLTGSAGTTSGCNQTTTCTFTQLKTNLNDGGDAPVVYTVAVAKGRDNMWIGAVDGLRLNTKVYDFERDGVKERGA
jgi:hypothetical protein